MPVLPVPNTNKTKTMSMLSRSRNISSPLAKTLTLSLSLRGALATWQSSLTYPLIPVRRLPIILLSSIPAPPAVSGM
jgi:hypothetical protein